MGDSRSGLESGPVALLREARKYCAKLFDGFCGDPDVVDRQLDRERATLICEKLTQSGISSTVRRIPFLPPPGMPYIDLFEIAVPPTDKLRALRVIHPASRSR
jgi:hypothetical protein